jgi:RNA polymerase sigma-70 factor, ECF subfamily
LRPSDRGSIIAERASIEPRHGASKPQAGKIWNRALSDERQLVERMLAGEERAFDLFFNTYFARVYRFALPRLSGDVEATREVVQAALTKAIRKLERYRGAATLFSWVCQICRHEIVDYLRAHRRHARHLMSADDDEVRAALESIEAPAEYDLVKGYGRAEVTRLVQAVLDRLPGRYGDALEWKYMEGRSVEEIGERLGIGETAAQSLLARARGAFREALETVFGASAADIVNGLET